MRGIRDWRHEAISNIIMHCKLRIQANTSY